ncbi:mediator of RNA polymerase II transcription subunit 15a-like isoform X2 [Tasmannia lanceolata]|uniref:mediator of RNA polymerase II transcription subunit 15a-like isoform X2 n=1 Tax=Tasmannia lanceolata TaxID=3420 RepID=UPI004062A44D
MIYPPLVAQGNALTANSPFIVPSPSSPLTPFTITGDPEKQFSGNSSILNTRSIGHQQSALAPAQSQSFAIGTPEISASPLRPEFTAVDGHQSTAPTVFSGKCSEMERPLDRLIKVVKTMSPKTFSSSVSDIGAIVSMIDMIEGSAPGNGSRAAVGKDLVAVAKCRLQARNFISQDGSAATKKIRWHTSAILLNALSSSGSENDSFKQLNSLETSDSELIATSRIKRQIVEANHALLDEIGEINQRLINTVVEISEDAIDSMATKGEGAVVKCSLSAVAVSPNFKSHYASVQMSPISPLRLLIPENYPNCSPILLDKLAVQSSTEFDDLAIKAKSRFCISLRKLSLPMSLGEMARTWDVCVRKVIAEYAQRNGGGSFS